MNNKKSFTLLEVVISISIFMIVLFFLYKTLDQTKYSDRLFEERENVLIQENYLSNIIVEDIVESTSSLNISFDDEKNARVLFTSYNTYHNAYFNNITYLISSNNKLVRVESLKKFEFENTPYDFYEDTFIDVLLEDIEFFDVSNNSFIIKQKNNARIVIKAFKLK